MTRAPNVEWLLRSRMRFRHFRLLVALDEHRNINRAAISVSISQPAASKLLAELEKIVGATLFERVPRGVVPTEIGEIFIRRARIIVNQIREAGDELSAAKVGHIGRVAVGLVEGSTINLLAPAVRKIQTRHPGIRISIYTQSSDSLIVQVQEERLDFAIGRIFKGYDPSPFEYTEAGTDEIRIVCRPNHPLRLSGRSHLGDMTSYPWIMPPIGTPMRTIVDDHFRSQNIAPPKIIIDNEYSSSILTFAIVEHTDTIAAMSSTIAGMFSPSRLYAFPQVRIASPNFGVYRLRSREMSPAAKALLQALLEPPGEEG